MILWLPSIVSRVFGRVSCINARNVVTWIDLNSPDFTYCRIQVSSHTADPKSAVGANCVSAPLTLWNISKRNKLITYDTTLLDYHLSRVSRQQRYHPVVHSDVTPADPSDVMRLSYFKDDVKATTLHVLCPFAFCHQGRGIINPLREMGLVGVSTAAGEPNSVSGTICKYYAIEVLRRAGSAQSAQVDLMSKTAGCGHLDRMMDFIENILYSWVRTHVSIEIAFYSKKNVPSLDILTFTHLTNAKYLESLVGTII